MSLLSLRTPLVAVVVPVLGLSEPAVAQITIDGTRDAAYGAPLAVQTVQTSFGDATSASGLGGGGELDAAYAVIEDGRLFVMITGNIEPNFNKLNLFIDSKSGGEITLSSLPAYDFEDLSQNLGGMTFDSGFAADYHVYTRWGGATGNQFTFDIVDRDGGGSATVNGNGSFSDSGGGTGIQSGVVDPTDLGLGSINGVDEARNLSPFLTQPVPFGFNNTNTAGVGGSGGSAANAAAAAAVTTGVEFSIDLVDLGSPGPGETIKIHAAYGNGDNNFHSNQTLGGLPVGSGNLGGDGSGGFTGTLSGIDFDDFAGEQFFSITVPSILGDLNGDGTVDGNDFGIFAGQFGESEPPDLSADLNDDGVVDGNDFGIFAGAFNEANGLSGVVSAVPEPASWACLVPVLMMCRRQRR